MRIGVFGAGAVGGIVGGLLTKAGRDVTLIDQWPAHVEKMRADGLRVTGTLGEHRVRVRALHLHEAQSIEQPFDVVIIAVKSYDTDWMTQLAATYLAPGGYAVDFQNGINDERVAAIVGRERTLGCVVHMLAGMYEPGHVMRTDRGAMAYKVGELDGAQTGRVRAFVDLLNVVAPTAVTTNLFGDRWSKLAVNCMANALAGISGLGSADVRAQPGPRRIAIRLAAEAIVVGRAYGHEIGPLHGMPAQKFVDAAADRGREALEAEMVERVQVLTGGRPSMLQDILRMRRTEIDFLNGHVSRAGAARGINTPFNDAIAAIVRAPGVGKLVPDPRNLGPLVALLPPAWRADLVPAA
ncbi:MAG TPA: 2-dehydropantoate 2-reductase [Kofleriaceae bacterium]